MIMKGALSLIETVSVYTINMTLLKTSLSTDLVQHKLLPKKVFPF